MVSGNVGTVYTSYVSVDPGPYPSGFQKPLDASVVMYYVLCIMYVNVRLQVIRFQ